MANFDLNNSTTTNFKNTVPDFIVDAKRLDSDTESEETWHYYTDAIANFGYLHYIPEVWSAANGFITWTVGQGWTTSDMLMKAQLDHVCWIVTGKQ